MAQSDSGRQRRFVFLLLPNFSMISFAAAIEPLRLANHHGRKERYTWTLMSETGEDVRCSNGSRIAIDSPMGEVSHNDTIVVCGGVGIKESASKAAIGWLRRESRKGGLIISVCTGAYALAKAGLLDGRKATIHWENYDSFMEEFHNVELSKSVFVQDRNRFTASGGISPVDLMISIIADDHGEELASVVADQLIYTSIRTEEDAQRLSVPARIGVRHPKLAEVIKMMEEAIEDPISPSSLASKVGMSARQLERLFRKYLNKSPKRYYMELRLQRARNFLMQTDMSVLDVAVACGFTSPSHFSKCYRTHYKTTPYRERGSRAASPA